MRYPPEGTIVPGMDKALKGAEAASPQAARSKAVSFSHDREGFLALRDRLLEQAGNLHKPIRVTGSQPQTKITDLLSSKTKCRKDYLLFTGTGAAGDKDRGPRRHMILHYQHAFCSDVLQ